MTQDEINQQTTPNLIPDCDESVVEEQFYVQNNPQLPSRRTRIKYQPWMLEEMRLCKKDILSFAERYFTIINLDTGRQKIKLYPIQKKALRDH